MGASFDLDVGCQRRGELDEWLSKDPLPRCEAALAALGVSDPGAETAIEQQIVRAMDAARAARRNPRPNAFSRIRMRTLTYAQAIREAHAQLLARDPRVFLIGQGLSSPWYAGGSLDHLDREFSRDRLLDQSGFPKTP